jgi:hypothetical protein
MAISTEEDKKIRRQGACRRRGFDERSVWGF